MVGGVEPAVERMGEEEQEFEIARRLIRLAGAAVQNATQMELETADPKAAAKTAVVAAAKAHAPGLVTSASNGRSPSGGGAKGGRATGMWYRRGSRIIITGA